MGCIYENNSFGENGGKCYFFVSDNEEMESCDENGYCMVSDDPDPSYSCDRYESDYTCSECGYDLNVGECECDE